jgi:hypothetical protein
MREALRVLKPGGRFAVSDIVVRGEIPAEIQRKVELWAGCVAGALQESDYREKLKAAGFENIEIEPTRIYSVAQSKAILAEVGLESEELAAQVDNKFMSAFVRARKQA